MTPKPEKKKDYNFLFKKVYQNVYKCVLCDFYEIEEAKMIAHIINNHRSTETAVLACYY